MTVCSPKKQNEQGCVESKQHLSSRVEVKREQIIFKPDSTDEVRVRVKKAIEADNLCYNCETGFHYMKQ